MSKIPKRDLGVSEWRSIEVPIAAVSNVKVWQSLTKETEKTTSNLETLKKACPLITALRWQTLKMRSAFISLSSLLEMKQERKQGEMQKIDLEVVYHPYMLEIFHAAATGIPGLKFVGENRKLDTREDFVLQVVKNGSVVASEPSESKRAIYYGADPLTAVDENEDMLGKLVKCIRDHYPKEQRHFLCTISERIGRVFIADIEMAQDGNVAKCSITPELPVDNTQSAAPDSILVDFLDERIMVLMDGKDHAFAEILPDIAQRGPCVQTFGDTTCLRIYRVERVLRHGGSQIRPSCARKAGASRPIRSRNSC